MAQFDAPVTKKHERDGRATKKVPFREEGLFTDHASFFKQPILNLQMYVQETYVVSIEETVDEPPFLRRIVYVVAPFNAVINAECRTNCDFNGLSCGAEERPAVRILSAN